MTEEERQPALSNRCCRSEGVAEVDFLGGTQVRKHGVSFLQVSL
jgi:hypothetical protein